MDLPHIRHNVQVNYMHRNTHTYMFELACVKPKLHIYTQHLAIRHCPQGVWRAINVDIVVYLRPAAVVIPVHERIHACSSNRFHSHIYRTATDKISVHVLCMRAGEAPTTDDTHASPR